MSSFTISTAEAKEDFSELINRVLHYNEHIVLTRRGKDVAALIPIQDLQLLQAAKNKNDLEEATEALKEARNTGTTSFEDLAKDIG